MYARLNLCGINLITLCSIKRRLLCWTWAFPPVFRASPAEKPQRLGRSERRPVDGRFFRWEGTAHGQRLKSRGRVMTTTDGCTVKRHSALPFFWRLRQRHAVSCTINFTGNIRWKTIEGIIHGASWAFRRCFPRSWWLGEFFLKRRLPCWEERWPISRREKWGDRSWVELLRQAQRTAPPKTLQKKSGVIVLIQQKLSSLCCHPLDLFIGVDF